MSDRKTLLHDAVVSQRTDFGHGYFELSLECPALAAELRAGQFINLRVRDELFPLLRRPFSSFDWLTDARGKPKGISVLAHVVGQGTELMSRMQPGQKLSINGPLGKAFEAPEDPAARVIMVGGGIGLAPFLHLIRQWPRLGHKHELMLLAGARAQRDLAFIKRFTSNCSEVLLATEDGSLGVKGRVTVLLEAEIKALRGKPAVVLTCGPWAMMAAVSSLCTSANIVCYASLERTMGCGFGVCNGCVAKVKEPSASGFRYAKTCVEGTVMESSCVVW